MGRGTQVKAVSCGWELEAQHTGQQGPEGSNAEVSSRLWGPGKPISLLPEAMGPWKGFIQGSNRVHQVLLKTLPKLGRRMPRAGFGERSSVIL